jgi:hypothetical protein
MTGHGGEEAVGAEDRKPSPVEESWAADVLRTADVHASSRAFIKAQLVHVIKADEGDREDIGKDLDRALNFLWKVFSDVIDDAHYDKGLFAKITEAAFV